MYPRIRKERRICCAAWCTKTSEESSFFKFPTNALRAKQWETALVYKTRLAKRALCSDHFEDKCFGSTLKTKLLSTAIPTRQVKVKEENISDDETSKSQFSESKIPTYSGTGNKSSPVPYRDVQEIEPLKRKCDIEKDLDEYLQKRHLVYNKLKKLEEEDKPPPPKKSNYKFPNNLSKEKKNNNYTVTVTKVGGDVRNVTPNKSSSKSNKTKKQKTNNAEGIKKLDEYDLNLMSCCLMKSIDERAELENDAIDDSKLEGFLIQVPKQSENKVKRLDSDALKSGAEKHLSKTIKRTKNNVIVIVKMGNNSSKASSLIESGLIKTEKEDVQNSSKILSMRTEGDVCKVVKGTENSSKSTSVSTENDVFMSAKQIEYLSKISSTVMESSASKSAKEKVENSSMLLSITPEKYGPKIVKVVGTNHESETLKVSRIESKDVSTSEISDDDGCDVFENYMSDKSDSNQSALELQSESNVAIKEHVSNTAIKAVENSPKTSSNVKEHLSDTAIKCIEKNLLTPSRSQNSVFHTAKERVEKKISAASDTSETESKDVCILEISDDYSSFSANVAERLKKLHNPFVRIKALLRIQEVLLEAESDSMTDKT